MTKLNSREMKALFVLSIVAPVSILASLRLTRVLQEPRTISETITLEAVKWEFERPQPDQSIAIFDNLNVTYVGNGASVTFSLELRQYLNGSMSWIPPGDWVDMKIVINATVTNHHGFVNDVFIVFQNDSQPSTAAWLRTFFSFENLSLSDVKEERNPEAFTKGYVRLTGTSRPGQIHFSTVAHWFLLDASSDRAHQIVAVYELIYYNGTAYKKVIQPFQLRFVGG